MNSVAKYVAAESIVPAICRELNYSRAHVINVLRENARHLRARLIERRWMLPAASVNALKTLVRDTSGPRYKSGEKGPNRK